MKPNVERIKELMAVRRWSASELARQMGVSRSETTRLLNGKRNGGNKVISGLIKAFPEESLETLFFCLHCTQMSILLTILFLSRNYRASINLSKSNILTLTNWLAQLMKMTDWQKSSKANASPRLLSLPVRQVSSTVQTIKQLDFRQTAIRQSETT